jgi:NAD(P)-dependent dehydrogenase (short-subunit alcohol dehydrogenase family)
VTRLERHRGRADNPSGAGLAGSAIQTMVLACPRVLITGATSGLGLAMAIALADAGAKVAVTGRDPERAEAVAGTLPQAVGVGLDVRDPESVSTAVDEVWSRLGGIDLLVNNAGVGMVRVNPRFMVDRQPFWTVPLDAFREIVDVNLTGYFLVASQVVPRMLDAGHGRIVNISTSEATMIRAGFAPYGPSRAASEALSRIMAAELAHTPVTVNVLIPGGPVATASMPSELRPASVRLLDPAVMGPPIEWLASRNADGVHDEWIVANDFTNWLETRDEAGIPCPPADHQQGQGAKQ